MLHLSTDVCALSLALLSPFNKVYLGKMDELQNCSKIYIGESSLLKYWDPPPPFLLRLEFHNYHLLFAASVNKENNVAYSVLRYAFSKVKVAIYYYDID